jgi:GcrA cell cycle regulator
MFAIKQPWTIETVELLKSRVDAGLSCREIAREIGVTRNAVAGKISRLKLSRPKHISGKHSEQKDGSKFRRSRVLNRYQILMALRAKQQPPAEEVPIRSGHYCSLLELTPEKCRWPISNPGEVDCRFCGNKPVEGLPYCAGHAGIAYQAAYRQRGGRD